MDKIIFTGHLGKDPETKTSQSGKNYTRFSVAVVHYDGNGNKSTEWRQVTAFGKTGEFCQKYLKTGSAVTVEGYPSPRAYIPKNGGDPVGVIDVRAESVDSAGGGNTGDNLSGNTSNTTTDVTGQVQDELPF